MVRAAGQLIQQNTCYSSSPQTKLIENGSYPTLKNSGLVPFLDKLTISTFLNHKFTKKNPLFYEEVLFWQEILVKDSMV